MTATYPICAPNNTMYRKSKRVNAMIYIKTNNARNAVCHTSYVKINPKTTQNTRHTRSYNISKTTYDRDVHVGKVKALGIASTQFGKLVPQMVHLHARLVYGERILDRTARGYRTCTLITLIWSLAREWTTQVFFFHYNVNKVLPATGIQKFFLSFIFFYIMWRLNSTVEVRVGNRVRL